MDKNEVNAFGTGLFVELTDESKEELLKDETALDKSILDNNNFIPLDGSFAVKPNK